MKKYGNLIVIIVVLLVAMMMMVFYGCGSTTPANTSTTWVGSIS